MNTKKLQTPRKGDCLFLSISSALIEAIQQAEPDKAQKLWNTWTNNKGEIEGISLQDIKEIDLNDKPFSKHKYTMDILQRSLRQIAANGLIEMHHKAVSYEGSNQKKKDLNKLNEELKPVDKQIEQYENEIEETKKTIGKITGQIKSLDQKNTIGYSDSLKKHKVEFEEARKKLEALQKKLAHLNEESTIKRQQRGELKLNEIVVKSPIFQGFKHRVTKSKDSKFIPLANTDAIRGHVKSAQDYFYSNGNLSGEANNGNLSGEAKDTYLIKCINENIEDFKTGIKVIENPKTWGAQEHLETIANVLGVNIKIITSYVYESKELKDAPTISLNNYNKKHWDTNIKFDPLYEQKKKWRSIFLNGLEKTIKLVNEKGFVPVISAYKPFQVEYSNNVNGNNDKINNDKVNNDIFDKLGNEPFSKYIKEPPEKIKVGNEEYTLDKKINNDLQEIGFSADEINSMSAQSAVLISSVIFKNKTEYQLFIKNKYDKNDNNDNNDNNETENVKKFETELGKLALPYMRLMINQHNAFKIDCEKIKIILDVGPDYNNLYKTIKLQEPCEALIELNKSLIQLKHQSNKLANRGYIEESKTLKKLHTDLCQERDRLLGQKQNNNQPIDIENKIMEASNSTLKDSRGVLNKIFFKISNAFKKLTRSAPKNTQSIKNLLEVKKRFGLFKEQFNKLNPTSSSSNQSSNNNHFLPS